MAERLAQSTVDELRAGFDGELILPEDSTYDEACKVFNSMIDRRPAVIARCASADDVVSTVNLARERDLEVAVRSGGHSVAGLSICSNGILIDLAGLKEIDIDPNARIARTGGGVLWGEFDKATQEHGLHTPGGRVTTTGVGGFTTGGGYGWTSSKHGLTCDNLISAEVVTADGRVLNASEEENEDLFWGIRGGGGNFGVVTEFHLRLHQLGPIVLGGMLVYTPDQGRDVVRFYRDFVRDAPDEVGSALAFICAPPEEFVPKEAWGQPMIGIVCCYAGPVEDGEAAFKPLREFGPPLMDMMQPMPYTAVQQLLDGANPKGRLNYWTADFLEELPDKAIDAMVEIATQPVSVFSQMLLIPGGGAIARVDEDATAFGQRNAPWNTHFLSMWEDPAETEKNIAYTREIAATMKPWTTGRAYLNFIGDEGEGRVEAAFGPERFKKLRELKKKWDPKNLFSRNQNIPPAE